jgi:ankyrin repeat protein
MGLARLSHNSHKAVVRLLIEKDVENYTRASGDGATLLSWASRKGHEAVGRLLIEKGAAVDST